MLYAWLDGIIGLLDVLGIVWVLSGPLTGRGKALWLLVIFFFPLVGVVSYAWRHYRHG
ncbi:MAG: PLDc N-terminal domain-containing protein [Firmicutes bacterium]|nr:PLDc N-terminal domain-containing protein [Bacillota bacterium]